MNIQSVFSTTHKAPIEAFATLLETRQHIQDELDRIAQLYAPYPDATVVAYNGLTHWDPPRIAGVEPQRRQNRDHWESPHEPPPDDWRKVKQRSTVYWKPRRGNKKQKQFSDEFHTAFNQTPFTEARKEWDDKAGMPRIAGMFKGPSLACYHLETGALCDPTAPGDKELWVTWNIPANEVTVSESYDPEIWTERKLSEYYQTLERHEEATTES